MSNTVLFMVLGLLCGVVGYRISHTRGRNALLWGWVCFLFPPALGFLFLTSKSGAHSKTYAELNERWDTLARYDPDVRGAVDRLSALGPEAVEQFKRTYADHPDKSAIPLILADIEAAWTKRAEQGLRSHETHKGVEILVDSGGQFHIEGRTTRDLATARVMATSAARGRVPERGVGR